MKALAARRKVGEPVTELIGGLVAAVALAISAFPLGVRALAKRRQRTGFEENGPNGAGVQIFNSSDGPTVGASNTSTSAEHGEATLLSQDELDGLNRRIQEKDEALNSLLLASPAKESVELVLSELDEIEEIYLKIDAHKRAVELMRSGIAQTDSEMLGDRLEELTREESAAVATVSAWSLDHALAKLFIRLGPPPEPIENDYAPAYNGGGGAQQ